MSKLADLIRRATRGESGPIGFASGPRKSPPTLALVALVGERWAQGVSEAAGADAILIAGRPGERDLRGAVEAAGTRPCGLLAPDLHGDQLAALRQAGLDFLVLGAQGPATALLDEDIGIVFHLRDGLSDMELRTLATLHLDAVYVERDPGAATIGRQIELQRISGLTSKPLVLRVSPDAQQAELRSLRDAGVGLVAVDMKERGAAEGLGRLRSAIDALPARRRRREEAEAALLRPAVAVYEEEEDEE